jgi:hypothetical protein
MNITMKSFSRLVFCLVSVLLCSVSKSTAQFIDSVASVSYGPNFNSGYGPDNPFFPRCLYGRPDSTATPFAPAFEPNQLLSLGTGGSITLYFRQPVINRAGADFTVFENVFYQGISGDTTNPFCETAFVSVSKDGITFRQFPYRVDTISISPRRYRYTGLAGTTPTNGAGNPRLPGSPLIAGRSGGDSFDLSAVNLDTVYFIRLTDCAALVPDGGNAFDLDAIAVINQSALSAPNPVQRRPTQFALEQNYPNPFNPTTGIRYQVSGTSDVRLEVFDMLGRKVSTLVSERQAAGAYTVNFNASGLASGTYLYRLSTNTFSETRRMMLLR